MPCLIYCDEKAYMGGKESRVPQDTPPQLHPCSIMIGWKIHPLFLQGNLKIPPQSHPLYNTYKRYTDDKQTLQKV